MDVVLPCLDEAAALPAVLASLPRGYRAIVVDNGSTDGSPAVAVARGALVVHEPRRGYGAAVHTGLLAATADLVAFADADGSLDLGELPAMAALSVAAGEHTARVSFSDEALTVDTTTLASGEVTLELENTTETSLLVVLEQSAWSAQAASAALVTALA